jgi:hypothetical protein
MTMINIFISYRRADSHAITDRIQDRLSSAFGQDSVFQDVEDLPPGVNYQDYIKGKISTGDVLLVIIGHDWINIIDDDGQRRILKPDDPVRLEIESGLNNPNMTVIPVLAQGATMPPPDELPESLRELHYRNALPMRNNPDFEHDIQHLIESVRQCAPGTATSEAPKAAKRPAWMIPAAALGIIALVVVVVSQVGIPGAAALPTATATPTVITDTPQPTEDREATVNARVAARLTQSAADTTSTAEAIALLVTNTPTRTPTATDVPTETPEPTATIRFPNGRAIEMFYDENSFYVLNNAASPIQNNSLSFQAINDNGSPLSYRFDGSAWARIYTTLDPGKCASLEIVNASNTLRPPACDGGYSVQSSPSRSSDDIFWVARDSVSHFRVLSNGVEAGRCEIAAQHCEVFIQ